MNNALSIYEGERFDLMQRTAQAMVKSGYFQDSRELAQAVVKVMAGAELGIAPFASMTGIHIVQGKPTLSSNLVATLVKNDPRYNYRVKVANDTECVLEWFENGELCGESVFTMQEAKAAGLTGKSTWKQYPSDMLFARALTRGARRHAPGIFGGAPVYTPEELGADVDEDGYTVVEHNEPIVTVSTPEPPAPATNGKHADVVEGEVEDEPLFPDDDKPAMPTKPSADQMKAFHAAGRAVYGDGWDDKRAVLVSAVTGGRSKSSTHLTRDEWKKLMDGINKVAEAA